MLQNNAFNPVGDAYHTEFWNALRQHRSVNTEQRLGQAPGTGAHALPAAQADKYLEELKKENFFRTFGTVMPMYQNDSPVKTVETEAVAEWVAENQPYPEDSDVLNTTVFGMHKLASIAKLHTDLLDDRGFDFQEWMMKNFARRFGKAEVNAFINGTGTGQPVGILNTYGGAEVGVTTASGTVTFDEVMALFHSLESKFRENAVWVMNDTTALALRKLKDADGNYLWSPSAEKLLGKEVIISNAMPDIGSGTKPIAFGDFSYYWIMERVPFSVGVLREKYAISQLYGYIGYEFLDGKLIRPEAVKVMQMAAAE
ncbi:MAG: phage major capsid protein [Oscillospiraceae bacterium]|nr:phage major capsid protein [Oscillospiraceae bacterium]